MSKLQVAIGIMLSLFMATACHASWDRSTIAIIKDSP